MMTDEEFEKMLIECGAERIKSTKDIVSHEKYYDDLLKQNSMMF